MRWAWRAAAAASLGALAVAPAEGRQAPPSHTPCAQCVRFTVSAGETLALPPRIAGLGVRLRVAPGDPPSSWQPALHDLRARGALAGLHILGVPDPSDPLLHADVTSFTLDIRNAPDAADAAAIDALVFQLKRAIALIRGRSGTTVDVVARPALATTLGARGLTDFGVIVRGLEQAPTASSLRDLLFEPTDDFWRLPGDPVAATSLVSDLVRVLPWLPPMVPGGTMACGTVRVPAFMDASTMQIVGVSDACPAGAPVTAEQPGATVQRLDAGGLSFFRVTSPAQDRFVETVGVTEAAALTADEIVARHQSQAAQQSAAIRTLISTGSLTLTFEAPGFVAPLTITSRTIIYTGNGTTDLQQQDIRVNGVPFNSGGGVPRLPIIEPERAAAPPLTITLNDLYRYRLKGRETIDGHRCYVIGFEPRQRGASLYEGRAWIAADSFAMVRVSATQTGLRGPITMSEQTDDFRDQSRGVWLLVRSDVRQTYEGASVRTPIHRLLVIGAHEVNAPDFDARRAAAYSSTDVILRDTAEGYRYLTRTAARVPSPESRGASPESRGASPESRGASPESRVGSSASGSPKPEAPSPEPERRVVAGRATRVRTLAFGVIVDPNISQPLPFAGLSYVDFSLFGTGTQFNGFYGGTFGQLAFSVPSIRGSRWQLAARAFGIATSYNDRAFEQGTEQYAQNISQRPAQASVWSLRPLSPRVSLRLGYDWDYTRFERTEVTDPAFVVPANQVVHAARVGFDLQRSGWQASAWWSPAWRVGWRPWGYDATQDDTRDDFQRYGLSVLRSAALTPRVVTRIEGALMGGRNLDRFSRFAFGSFDNRLHGYPSALIRYDYGAVLRTAVAWSAAKSLRLDGFADTAQVRDPGFGTRTRNFTGFGAAVEAPAPFGTLLAIEWGFGLQGIDPDGDRGTHVVRISGYKVF